jgi:hypothetical protein
VQLQLQLLQPSIVLVLWLWDFLSGELSLEKADNIDIVYGKMRTSKYSNMPEVQQGENASH